MSQAPLVRQIAATKSCTFCQIQSGALPAAEVYQDDLCVAFLDRRPLFLGHTLLVPRAHYETLPDLPSEQVGPFFVVAQVLSRAVQNAMGADGIFNAVNNQVSQSVPHFHLHIVPRRRGDGLKGFFWPRQSYESPDAMDEVAQLIRAALAR